MTSGSEKPTETVTMVFCLRRRADLSAREFAAYWSGHHAELFARYADALNVQRYSQTHLLDNPINDALRQTRGGPAAFDGVAQVWFDSMDDLLAGVTSAAGRQAGQLLIDDERNFIDHENSPIWVATERQIPLPN